MPWYLELLASYLITYQIFHHLPKGEIHPMATFSVDIVEGLDFDFTGIPANSGTGKCKGKGTIPEPTQDRLNEYSKAVNELFQVTNPKEAVEAMRGEETHDEALLVITADLCQQKPSAEQLKALPPRYRNAFMTWVYQELTNPEVLSADTAL